MPDMATKVGDTPTTTPAASVAATRPSLWTAIIVGAAVAYLAFARASFSRLG